MPSSILLRTFGGIQDNRAVVKQSNFIRPFYAGNWNKLRVCVRHSVTDGGAGIFPPPNHIAVGLCSGSDFDFNSANTKQFIGIITNIGTAGQYAPLSRIVGPPFSTNNRPFPANKVASVITGVNGGTAIANHNVPTNFCQYDGIGGPYRSLLFVDITRPNSATGPTSGMYTIAVFTRIDGLLLSDASATDFLTQAIAPLPVFTHHKYYTTPTEFTFPGIPVEISGDETSLGPLDHVCIASDEARYDWEVSDVGFVRLI